MLKEMGLLLMIMFIGTEWNQEDLMETKFRNVPKNVTILCESEIP